MESVVPKFKMKSGYFDFTKERYSHFRWKHNNLEATCYASKQIFTKNGEMIRPKIWILVCLGQFFCEQLDLLSKSGLNQIENNILSTAITLKKVKVSSLSYLLITLRVHAIILNSNRPIFVQHVVQTHREHRRNIQSISWLNSNI